MATNLIQEVLDTLFSVLQRIRIFMLKRDKSVLWGQLRHEEEGEFHAESLAEEVEITIPSFDLSHFGLGEEVVRRSKTPSFVGTSALSMRPIRLNAILVVTLIEDVVLAPLWPNHLHTYPVHRRQLEQT